MKWGVVTFLVALAGVSVFADVSLVFPEVARGDSRIVSGWEANEGQIPYQLSLRMVNTVGQVSSCGGSIIHNEWGLTAAHCTALRVTVVVRFGTVNLTRPNAILETTEYYNHPLYIEALQTIVQPNDIGVVKFPRRIEYNDYIKPIRIQRSADKNVNYQGVQMVASGWGRLWTGGNSPENMNWVYLLGTNNEFCRNAFSGSTIVQDSTICAAYYNVTSQSTCQGDSGGPLTIVDKDGERTIVGVTSFVSSAGCHTVLPAGFVRPGFYHDWFLELTGINFDWDFDFEEPEVPEKPETEEEDEDNDEDDEDDDDEDDDDSDEDDDDSDEDDDDSDEDDDDSDEDDDDSDEDDDSSESDSSSEED